jgi:S-adenosylmethionine hydrolase
MKGVALGICPDVTFVDITHEIEPQDVLGAALQLAAAFRYFPAASIFLVVVDPGVGSTRRGIAAELGDYRFVAPDNGVLSLVLDQMPLKRVVELTDARYARPTISKTFEGRDRFAPAAAWLANGIELTALGRPASSLVRLDLPSPRSTSQGVDGEILAIDRFGNLITNIDDRMIARMAGAPAIHVGSRVIPHIVSTYNDVAPGELCALLGSSDRLEIAVNGGSAAATLAVGRGAVVQLRRGA